MAKLLNNLKKIEVGNPLFNLGLINLYDQYEATKTDEELVDVYHSILDAVEGSEIAESLTYSMIAFSTSQDECPLYCLMVKTLQTDGN